MATEVDDLSYQNVLHEIYVYKCYSFGLKISGR